MIRVFILLMLLQGCNEPKVYECGPFDKRPCLCPNGEIGVQACSRGPAWGEPKPPRKWKPCSCCFHKDRDEHGIYYIDRVDASGCWDDVYNPSLPTKDSFEEGDE